MNSSFKNGVVDKLEQLKLRATQKDKGQCNARANFEDQISHHNAIPNLTIVDPESSLRKDPIASRPTNICGLLNDHNLSSSSSSQLVYSDSKLSANESQVSSYMDVNFVSQYATMNQESYLDSKYFEQSAQCSYNQYSTSVDPYSTRTNYGPSSLLTSNHQYQYDNNQYPYEMHPVDPSLNDLDETGDQSLQLEYRYLNFNFSGAGIPIKEIVEILGPEEVRWFYKTEGDKKWTPFIGYDSLRIEWAYRDLLQKPTNRTVDSSQYPNQLKEDQCERPVVCGGLYEVDVSVMKGFSIYWKAEEFTIMRGTWFYEGTWLPVEENIAEKIETQHLAQFIGQNVHLSQGKDVNHEVIHSLTLSEGHIDWFSASEIFFSHDATPSRLMRSVSKKFGFQKTGYKLHRGYCLDASSADKPPDITHIVFVIHGIGQKMDTGRIIKNCTSLRENMKWLKEKHFPESEYINQSVEFFPVEWRSSLTLDAGVIESITPHKIIGLRQMLNASFMDIMYYNSPQYREEIVNGLTSELDRLYTMFTARNPYFEANGGKVSVLAHSLGCVITYDIITGWSPAPQMSESFLHALIDLSKNKSYAEGETTLYSFQSALQHVLELQLAKTSQPRLKFKIENFFCLGSPLAVFLGLRWKRQETASPPFNPNHSFERLFNIFHPADPVAYRVEPLICSKFSSIAPVTIQAYSAPDKTPYDEVPIEPLNLAPVRNPKENTNGTKMENPVEPTELDPNNSFTEPSSPSKAANTSWNFWNFMKNQKKSSDSAQLNAQVDGASDDVVRQRIDFVLREGSMESSYLSALTSHTSYWGNVDVAYFLLSILCPQYVDAQKLQPKL